MVKLGGRPILASLSSHQNFGGQTGCQFGREKCLASLDTDCRITRAVYKTLCIECKDSPTSKPSLYVGTTGRTVHSTSFEHQAALRRKDGYSAFSVHQYLIHPDKEPRFENSIIRGGMRVNNEGLIREANEIEEQKINQTFNILKQRSEWGNAGLFCLSNT